jgi:hypothetical protein
MANGILGTPTALTGGGTGEVIYTVPGLTFSVVSINVCNRSTGTRNIRIALADADTPGNEDYIEYDTELQAGGSFERSGIVIGADTRIIVYANSTDVTAMAYGIETATS